MFSEEEIPKSWYTGPLTPTNRRKIMALESLGGGRFSVFAKIEIGMSILSSKVLEFDLVFSLNSKALVTNVEKTLKLTSMPRSKNVWTRNSK